MLQTEQSKLEAVLIGGDLAKLNFDQRAMYYQRLCETLGLNPLTQPFQYLQLGGKLVLYATKNCAEQLRQLRGVSITSMTSAHVNDVYVVTATAQDERGRTDIATGAVPIGGLKGDALANALMKAETKSKRRCTLSLCGLGMMDETEVDTVADAKRVDMPIPTANGNISRAAVPLVELTDLTDFLPLEAHEPEHIILTPEEISREEFVVTDLLSLCNWAMDLYPDTYHDDENVKSALRLYGVKTWGKNTDINALKLLLAHKAGVNHGN